MSQEWSKRSNLVRAGLMDVAEAALELLACRLSTPL